MERIVTDLGYEYVDTEFVKDYGSNVLRILIYKEEGITTEDCKKISMEISDFLDKQTQLSISTCLKFHLLDWLPRLL